MEAFAALAENTRRRIVEELAEGERSVGDLVSMFELTQPAISQHLKVLKDAGLVRVRPDAQWRLYSLDTDGLRPIELWLERYRRVVKRRLDAFERHIDEQEGKRGRAR